MRVCLISREYPPASGWGGIATYTYHQAHGLQEIGHEVEVFALAALDTAGVTSLEDGITVHRVAYDDALNDLKIMQTGVPFTHYVLKHVLALAQKVFEVHSQNPFDVAEAAEHLAEGLGIAVTGTMPLVIRLHTPQSKLIAEKFHNLTASFDQESVAILERLAMNGCDVLTSPSEDMARYVAEDLGCQLDSIDLIRNPVDTEKFCPEGRRALAYGDQQIVLFVGRLEERKGVHYLVKAIPQIVAEHHKVHFVFIGSDTDNGAGQRSVLAELRASLQDSGATEKVTFIPQVPLAEIADYYRSADICVLPSLYDNAPCTCLEAMSVGKPVITTSSGGSSEYVIDGECGTVVPPRDEKQLAAAIIDLLKNKEKRLTLGKGGRERVLLNYKRTTIAANSLPSYNRAIENHQVSKNRAMYLKGGVNFLRDTHQLLKSYEQMLYNLLYVQSAEFRLKHRIERAKGMVKTWTGS